MAVLKSIPMQRVIGGIPIETSEISIVTELEYQTNGESLIIAKELPEIKIQLNSDTTDHTIIKALTNVTITPIKGKIDEEYSEIKISKGACVELYFSFGNWYIVSSDGLKQS